MTRFEFGYIGRTMKSNQEWIEWGTHDPLFGVASWPGRERGGIEAWTDEAFYDVGRSDWAEFIARWVVYGVDTSSCVEIGSGAGRLTKFISGTFDRVYAVDVSNDMLHHARKNIDATNVEFLVTNGRELPLESQSVAAAFSTHVFQHFDSPADGASYLAELARVLTDKSSLMLHLPMHVFPGPAKLASAMRLLYLTRKKGADLKAAYRRLACRLIGAKPSMRRLSYEMEWVLESLRGLNFTDVEFTVFPVSSNGHMHSFVFARRGLRPPDNQPRTEYSNDQPGR